MGQVLVTFGSALMRTPTHVTFSEVPEGGRKCGYASAETSAFVWDAIPDKAVIARLIQELRQAIEQRDRLEEKLARPIRLSHCEFTKAFAEIGTDPDNKPIILTGTGDDFSGPRSTPSFRPQINARTWDSIY